MRNLRRTQQSAQFARCNTAHVPGLPGRPRCSFSPGALGLQGVERGLGLRATTSRPAQRQALNAHLPCSCPGRLAQTRKSSASNYWASSSGDASPAQRAARHLAPQLPSLAAQRGCYSDLASLGKPRATPPAKPFVPPSATVPSGRRRLPPAPHGEAVLSTPVMKNGLAYLLSPLAAAICA